MSAHPSPLIHVALSHSRSSDPASDRVRQWCRWFLLLAVAFVTTMVPLNALAQGTPRSYTYKGGLNRLCSILCGNVT